MTVNELLHGPYAPSPQEFTMWLAYYKYKSEEEEKASKKSSSSKGASQEHEVKPTMGK